MHPSSPPHTHTYIVIHTPFKNNAGIKIVEQHSRGTILNGSRGDSLQTIFFPIESCLRCNGHFEVSEVRDEGSASPRKAFSDASLTEECASLWQINASSYNIEIEDRSNTQTPLLP